MQANYHFPMQALAAVLVTLPVPAFSQSYFDNGTLHRASQYNFPYSRAEAKAIMAMAQFHLNQSGEARDSLSESEMIVRDFMPRLESGNLGGDWRDCIISRALLKEAINLINTGHIPESQAGSK